MCAMTEKLRIKLGFIRVEGLGHYVKPATKARSSRRTEQYLEVLRVFVAAFVAPFSGISGRPRERSAAGIPVRCTRLLGESAGCSRIARAHAPSSLRRG